MSDLISNYLSFSLVVVVWIVILGGGVHLILRPLILWYFKIYSIETELKKNNALLRDILDELAKKNVQTPSSYQPKEDYSKYMPR